MAKTVISVVSSSHSDGWQFLVVNQIIDTPSHKGIFCADVRQILLCSWVCLCIAYVCMCVCVFVQTKESGRVHFLPLFWPYFADEIPRTSLWNLVADLRNATVILERVQTLSSEDMWQCVGGCRCQLTHILSVAFFRRQAVHEIIIQRFTSIWAYSWTNVCCADFVGCGRISCPWCSPRFIIPLPFSEPCSSLFRHFWGKLCYLFLSL